MGEGFSNWILVHLLEAWYLLQDLDSSFNDSIHSIPKLAAQNFFTSLATWGLLYEGKHIPLTSETAGFAAQTPDVVRLAAAEEKEEIETGSDNTSQRFLPSAIRVHNYLHKKRLEKVFGREGDPQAAVHGQWRHAALMQFTDEEQAEIFAFEKRMRSTIAGRRLFSTIEGMLGLGPRSMFDEGPVAYRVFILKGTKVPYILKRMENGTYRLVGEAYVHGIMHGEAVNMLEKANPDRSCWQRIKLA
jgi:hypothetical protein